METALVTRLRSPAINIDTADLAPGLSRKGVLFNEIGIAIKTGATGLLLGIGTI